MRSVAIYIDKNFDSRLHLPVFLCVFHISMSYPLNPAEAKAHIREIRRKRGVFDDEVDVEVDVKENWNLQDLDKALQMLIDMDTLSEEESTR